MIGIADVYYTYTPQEQEERQRLIGLIETEKRAYLERIDPYVKQLANIHGMPNVIVRRASA